MNGRRLDWAKAKHDAVKNSLVPTGEDIDPYEEARLQRWHEDKKSFPKNREPIERENDTSDVVESPGLSLLWSVTAQVEFRERQRVAVERKIAEARLQDEKRRAFTRKGSRKRR